MRLLPTFLAAIAIIAPAFSSDIWLSDLEQAKKIAAKENKSILLVFTDSLLADINKDYFNQANPEPCRQLDEVVFKSPQFAQFAQSSLVLVKVDVSAFRKDQFAGIIKLPEETKIHQADLVRQYPQDGHPSVYLLDDKGIAYWLRSGSTKTTDPYIAEIQLGLNSKAKLLASYEAAQKTTGLEHAKLVDKTLRSFPEKVRSANLAMYEEIIAHDKDDVLGYAKLKEEKMAKVRTPRMQRAQSANLEILTKELSPLLLNKKYTEAKTKVNAFLEQKDLTTESRQKALILYSQVLLASGDIDKSLENLDAAAKLDSTNEFSKQAEGFAKKIRTDRSRIERELKAQQ